MPKQKHTLYITLQHRSGKPGYHWAIMLSHAVKLQSSDINVKDSYLFHVINTVGPEYPEINSTGRPPWRYETKPVNSLRSGGNMIGRVLVAKLTSSIRIEICRGQIDDIVKQILVIQNNINWTCRIWVEHALAALRATMGPFAVIPEVINGGDIENRIIKFGNEAMDKIRNGKRAIRNAGDLPHIDMRVRSNIV